MDIASLITKVVKKIQSDSSIAEKFKKNPKKTVLDLLGIDLSADQLNQIVDGVKAKIGVDNIAGALGGLFGKK